MNVFKKVPIPICAVILGCLLYTSGDFEGLFMAMGGRPVTIRFLDPPLHEFLPQEEEDIIEIAGEMNMSVADLKQIIADLHEFNPMLGHRGCRLAVTMTQHGVELMEIGDDPAWG